MPQARSLRYGPHSYQGLAEKRSSSARPVASARRACSAVGVVAAYRHQVSPPGREWCQGEEVPGPGLERDVEPVAEVVAAALVALAGGGVVELPRLPAQLVPRQRDVAGRRRVAEVHDDERRDVAAPAPGRRGSASCRCPPSRRTSPSCHSPVRKTRVARARSAAARRTPSARGRPAPRAGGRGRPAAAPSAPRAGPRARAGRPSGSARSRPRRAPSRRGRSLPPAARRGSRRSGRRRSW